MKRVGALLLLAAILLPSGMCFAGSDSDSTKCFPSPVSISQDLLPTDSIDQGPAASALMGLARAIAVFLVTVSLLNVLAGVLVGEMEIKAAMVRIFLVAVALSHYGQLKDLIVHTADGLAAYIGDGQGPNTLMSRVGLILHASLARRTTSMGWFGFVRTFATVASLLFGLTGLELLALIVTTILAGVIGYAIFIVRSYFLMLLGLFGPVCLSLGILKSSSKIARGWLHVYTGVALWSVIYSVLYVGLGAIYDQVLSAIDTLPANMRTLEYTTCFFSGSFLGIVAGVISIFSLISAPRSAKALVEGFSMGMGSEIAAVSSRAKQLVMRGAHAAQKANASASTAKQTAADKTEKSTKTIDEKKETLPSRQDPKNAKDRNNHPSRQDPKKNTGDKHPEKAER